MTTPQDPTAPIIVRGPKADMPGDPKAPLHARVDHDFGYHTPQSQEVGELLDSLRAHCRELAHTVIDLVPAGRDLSMALTDLETSQRCALAAVVKNQDQLTFDLT